MSLIFTTKDKMDIPVTLEMASLSRMVQEMFDLGIVSEGKDMSVPLQFDRKQVLCLVEWMNLYCEAKKKPAELPVPGQKKSLAVWERRFFESLERRKLMSLLNVANFLQVNELLDSGTTFIAEKIGSKSVDEIRTYLGQKNDFTVNEERELQERFSWIE